MQIFCANSKTHKSKKIGEKEKDPWNQEHDDQINTRKEMDKSELSQKEQKLKNIGVVQGNSIGCS